MSPKKPASAERTKSEPPRVVAFTPDGLVRQTCLAAIEDGHPEAAHFAVAYALMRLVEMAGDAIAEEKEGARKSQAGSSPVAQAS